MDKNEFHVDFFKEKLHSANLLLAQYVEKEIDIKIKRNLYSALRKHKNPISLNSFLPVHAMTVGEWWSYDFISNKSSFDNKI